MIFSAVSAGTITVDQDNQVEALAAEVGVQNGANVTRGVWGVEGAQLGEPMTDISYGTSGWSAACCI
jgi:hypothetical protein